MKMNCFNICNKVCSLSFFNHSSKYFSVLQRLPKMNFSTFNNKKKKLNVCVLGTGSFGTALGTVAARAGHDVTIVGRTKEIINEINESNSNSKYFKELKLPLNLKATSDKDAVKSCDLIIHALPVQISVSSLKDYEGKIKDGTPIIIASKGILLKEKKFISEIWNDIFEKERNIQHMILSGPSFAIEIIKNFSTVVTLGCRDIQLAKSVQKALSYEGFRIYTTDDVIGVEIGGALKNVVAIMAGLIEGYGYKYNTLCAVLTRCVFEISLFSKEFGGRAETLNGLSGIGDIMLSSLGDLSRNKNVGLALARGETIEQIIEKSLEVAEGVPTLKVLHEIIKEHNFNMPLCDTAYQVAYEKLSIEEAKKRIMLRVYEEEYELKIK